MRKFLRSCFWIVLSFFIGFNPVTAIAQNTSLFGRYVGILKHEALNKEQLAKLDFVVSRSSSNELELKAILTLHFGDFKSGEYLSYHYDKVRYNVLTGTLVFDNVEQPLSIFVKGFSSGKLVGEVSSIWAGRVGQLILNQTSQSVKPTSSLIEPVGGEYAGSCGDENARLQLHTMRSTEDLAHLAQPFSSYFIKGSLYTPCRNGSCRSFQLSTNSSYNFFANEGQLILVGPKLTLRCDVDEDMLHCNEPGMPNKVGSEILKCSFKRISGETAGIRQLSPVVNSGAFIAESNETPLSPEGLTALKAGEYRGYVFHEYLGVYQPASLIVNLFQGGSGTEGGARISAFARLYFGDFNSREIIPYRFAEKAYPNPILGSQNLVFERIDTNMDAVIQITEIKDGAIRGNWHSIIFGRVGPFEFHKDKPPVLPENAKKMERLSGSYLADKENSIPPEKYQWFIQLQAMPGLKPPTTTENPFFPNFILGTISLPGVTGANTINSGSYDFYTGRFGFIQEPTTLSSTGPIDHSWIGQVSHRQLQLHHVAAPSGGGIPLNKFQPKTFRLAKEFP